MMFLLVSMQSVWWGWRKGSREEVRKVSMASTVVPPPGDTRVTGCKSTIWK